LSKKDSCNKKEAPIREANEAIKQCAETALPGAGVLQDFWVGQR
jgi:hypothetical protein